MGKKGFRAEDGRWICLSCGSEATLEEVKWRGKTYVTARCMCGNEDIIAVRGKI
jgi:hypothetical protein